MSKTCPGCGGSGPFGKNKTRPDGQSYLCKSCRAADQRSFVANNPEKVEAMRRRNDGL